MILAFRTCYPARSYRFVAATVCVLLAVFAGGAASAQQITPSHVNQVVDELVLELELLHDANFSAADLSSVNLNLTARRPRHVLQKGREVFLKVQSLRFINGLPPRELPAMPVREIKPSDVKRMVDDVLSSARELRSVYGVTAVAKKPALQSGLKPTDVYRTLIRASAMVDQLGVPGTVPNDVYRVALTINNEIELIRAKVGINVSVPAGARSKGKSPADAYNQGFALLNGLKSLTEGIAEYKIPGGVVLPTKKTGAITPSDVLDLLNNILAELSAIKVKTGVATSTQLVAAQSGKTPSDVYDALGLGVALVDTISTKSSIN